MAAITELLPDDARLAHEPDARGAGPDVPARPLRPVTAEADARDPSPAPVPWRARMARRATVGVGHASRRLHLGGGSVIGGRVGLWLDPELLATLGTGRHVALVSGTNGKTTTTTLLAAACGGPTRVATSVAGANLPAGLAAALAAAPGARRAVLEVDEGYLGTAVDALRPEVVVLLNLSRDQLDRVNEVRKVAARWRHVAERAARVHRRGQRGRPPRGMGRAAGRCRGVGGGRAALARGRGRVPGV